MTKRVLKGMYGPAQGFSGRFEDDLTGQLIKDELVLKARAVKLEYFNSKGVWREVARAQAQMTTEKPPATVRWVDMNKGDKGKPDCRSRLVARQMKFHDQSGQSFLSKRDEQS